MICKNKKGGIHTIEATIAFIAVAGFIIFVMPGLVDREDVSAVKRNYVYGSLSNLEKTGKLNDLAVAGNLSGIAVEINKTLAAPMKFTVGMSKLNVTVGTVYPKESQSQDYINFTADASALDSAKVELEYVNATNPVVYANGNLVSNRTGEHVRIFETLDITPETISGQNSIALETSNNATINYRLRIMSSLELGVRPAKKTINTINYMVAGNASTFEPAEIRVYIWR